MFILLINKYFHYNTYNTANPIFCKIDSIIVIFDINKKRRTITLIFSAPALVIIFLLYQYFSTSFCASSSVFPYVSTKSLITASFEPIFINNAQNEFTMICTIFSYTHLRQYINHSIQFLKM